LVEGVEDVKSGSWKSWRPKKLLGQDVWGATLGIIGLGRIGRAMARRGLGFNMRVLYTDPEPNPQAEAELGVEFRTLEDLLAESDFLSIHCPLTPQTEDLIGADELQRMKPTAVLINTARGPVVESDALVEALRTGQIAGAGLDVTDPEPLPADHPLAALPNCVVTPHIASASVTSRSRMAEVAADNLLAGLRGKRLPFCVNPQVYEK
jgi:lactate dehydrogenase-like 2-hydroxyacid dehydrogenase